MRWAAGLPVPGVPPNPTPARVINLSLGGDGTCSALYTQAIAEIIIAAVITLAVVAGWKRLDKGAGRSSV